MANPLSIKIRICDRDYPMRVESSEEERLRVAGKMLNDKIKQYRDQFGIDDKQDLLAMVAFDCLVEQVKSNNNISELNHLISGKISSLDKLLANTLGE